MDAYLTKPFDPSEMIRVVRELAGHPPVADRRARGGASAAGDRAGRDAGPRRCGGASRPGRGQEQARPLVHVELGRQRVSPETQFRGEPREPGPGIARASALATVGRAPSNAAVTKSV